ncbi:hypothetical protein ACIQWN_37755 [Streptomyces vinaceus]|uniref:hypothetical protein n=1 Tax=Streptomyces vinaceus TaxID=1960 RepID=UPI0037F208F8
MFSRGTTVTELVAEPDASLLTRAEWEQRTAEDGGGNEIEDTGPKPVPTAQEQQQQSYGHHMLEL